MGNDVLVKNLKDLTLFELEEVVSKYPWFAAARKEIYRRMLFKGEEFSKEAIKRVAPYLESRERTIRHRVVAVGTEERENVVEGAAEVAIVEKEISKERDIFVVGGDYFGKEDYQALKQTTEDALPYTPIKMTYQEDVVITIEPQNDTFSDDEYCTETLAKIYASQGCYKRAREVYDKLILLYPEKNTYFAALKEELKKEL